MNAKRNADSLKIAGPFILALLILFLPVVLWADEPDCEDKEAKLVIVGEDGEEMVIEMGAVHEIVADALSGLDEVMAELEDMQFQVRLGRDNRLDLSYEDTTFELDLDQVMSQVSVALQAGLDEFDTEDWTGSHDRWEASTDEDLRRELKKLQQEMKELRQELKKVGDSRED
ncbi:MAG: hypothetical protein ABFS42_09950 [Candidatus Krumholzibacteriota bacterium]